MSGLAVRFVKRELNCPAEACEGETHRFRKCIRRARQRVRGRATLSPRGDLHTYSAWPGGDLEMENRGLFRHPKGRQQFSIVSWMMGVPAVSTWTIACGTPTCSNASHD